MFPMVPREVWERCIMVESERSARLRELMRMGFGSATVLTGATALAQEIRAGEPLEAAVSSAWDVMSRLHALDVAGAPSRTPLEKAYAELRRRVAWRRWEHRAVPVPIRLRRPRPRIAGRYVMHLPR